MENENYHPQVSDDDLQRMAMDLPGSYPSGTVASVARDLITARKALRAIELAGGEFGWSCTDEQERPATPEEVDAGYELGVFFYDCGNCESCIIREALHRV